MGEAVQVLVDRRHAETLTGHALFVRATLLLRDLTDGTVAADGLHEFVEASFDLTVCTRLAFMFLEVGGDDLRDSGLVGGR